MSDTDIPSAAPAHPAAGEIRLPTPESHPLLFRLARQTGRAISFFDIEATGLNHQQPSFGVMEFACVAVMPDGKSYQLSSLIDPENPIGQKAQEITGITPEMVAGKQNFGARSAKMLSMFEKSHVWGFNSHSYDVPAIMGQFDRYQVARPAKIDSLDLRDVWCDVQGTRSGRQVDLAAHYGVVCEEAHRALADVTMLVDIAEQMLWQHGVAVFSKHTCFEWDCSQPANSAAKAARSAERAASGAPSAPRSRGGELTATQLSVKAAIDEALPKNLSVEQFADELSAKGIRLEVTKGGAAYIAKGAEGADERCGGSQLGQGYSWKDVLAKLSGDIPQRLYGAGPVYGARAPKADASNGSAPTRAPRSDAPNSGARGAEESRAKEALLELAKGGGSIDFAKAAQMSGASARSVSFAVSALLADGSVQPAQASAPEAQQWLDSRWAELPTQGKLTPLLDACKKLGAPEAVDFAQLRVAVASRKAQMPRGAPAGGGGGAPRAPSGNGGYAGAPRQAAPPAMADFAGDHPFGGDEPPFDDMPPQDVPNAARMSP